MFRDWIDNPVVRRETQVLQRGKIPAILFAGGPVLLGLFFFFNYLVSSVQSSFDPSFVPGGRAVFGTLSLGLFWGLMLFVPALVGASINKDRQAGTLSTLRLTHLSTWQILLGKLSAFTAFYALVFLATSPIVGLTFLMGGVSVSEFLGILLLTLAAAFQCSILSLLSGLVFKRSAMALVGGFILSLLYLILLPNLSNLIFWAAYSSYQVLPQPWLQATYTWADSIATDYNPYVFPTSAIVKVFAPGAMPTVALGPLNVPFWLVTFAATGLTSILTLAAAAYLMRIEFWLRPRRALGLRLSRGPGKLYRPENLLDERRNPFLNWELRRHPVQRYRRATWVLCVGCGIGIILLFVGTSDVFYHWFGGIVLVLTWLWVALIPIFYCSQTVVHEKEMGTYDSLVLTLLQPRQIIESKLRSCLLYVLPVLGVVAVLCFLGQFTPGFSSSNWLIRMNFIWLGLQVVRCFYYAMLGIFFSLYCRSTLHALAYTVGAEVLLTIPYSVLYSVFGCCSTMVMMPFTASRPGISHFPSLGLEYLTTALQSVVPVIFMLIVIRVLYDRAVNLMRFESYRR